MKQQTQATPELLHLLARAASFGEDGFTIGDIDLDHRTDAFKAAYDQAVSGGLIIPMCALSTKDQKPRLMLSSQMQLAA